MIEIINSEDLPEDKQEKPKSKRTKLVRSQEYRNSKPLERAELVQQNLPQGFTADLSKALKLKLQGLNNADIASVLGVKEGVIQRALAKFSWLEKIDSQQVQAYTDNELEIIDYVRQLALTAAIQQLQDPERAKKIDILRLNNLFGTLFDKMRLIRGQSTQNISALSKLVLDAHSRRQLPGQDTDNGEISIDKSST